MTTDVQPTDAQRALLRRLAMGMQILANGGRGCTIGWPRKAQPVPLARVEVLLDRGWIERSAIGWRISEAGRVALKRGQS